MVGLLVVAAVVSHVTSGKTGRGEKGLVERLTQYVPLQSVKIVVVAWQILTQVGPTAGERSLGDDLGRVRGRFVVRSYYMDHEQNYFTQLWHICIILRTCFCSHHHWIGFFVACPLLHYN